MFRRIAHGIKDYWYDKGHIETGDAIIHRINEGLSKCKIGMIIFSRNYLQKDWTTWDWLHLTYIHTYVTFIFNEKILLSWPQEMNIQKDIVGG
jgi:hypothetical protein